MARNKRPSPALFKAKCERASRHRLPIITPLPTPLDAMKPSSTSSNRSARRRRGAEGYNTTDSAIGIEVVGPAETEGPMQVPVDGLTLDGSHAGHGILQEGPISPLLIDGHRLDYSGWDTGYLSADYQHHWSPVSSPPCSPSPSSGGSTPESAFVGHELESNPLDLALLNISEEESALLHFQQDSEERLARREQVLSALILQGSPNLLGLPDFAHQEDFDVKELALLTDCVVDQHSPSPEQLQLNFPSSVALSRSVSDPVPSRKIKAKKRGSTPPPLTRKASVSARRSHRRASAGSPYPSPHSSPSLSSPYDFNFAHLPSDPNSTSSSQDILDRDMYRHASTSTSSLTLPPRGPHAAPGHAPNYPPELRPQSPSVAQRTLARANRRRSRSTSPFDSARRSSSRSRSRSDAFAQVPNFLAQSGRNVTYAGSSASLPAPQASKGYRLRGATFEAQPVIYAGGTQRPSSMVRGGTSVDDAMSSSSGDEGEIGYATGLNEVNNGRGRRVSVSSSSSSLSSDLSLSLPPPPHLPSPSALPTSAGEKHVAYRNYYQGGDMAVDSRGNESDIDEAEYKHDDEVEERRRGKERELAAEKERRRSSYPSQPYPSHSKNMYGTPTYSSGSHLPSPSYTPSTLRDEVALARVPGMRSQSHSPSREDRSRSLSRVRYTPMAPAQRLPPTQSSASTSKGQAGPVRRSRRLSKSPTRQGVSASKGKVEHILDQPFEPASSTRHRSPTRRNSGAAASKPNVTTYAPNAAREGRPRGNSGNGNSRLSGRSRSRDLDYTSYRPHHKQVIDTDEEEDLESGLDYDEDDDDYCEPGSYRSEGRKNSPTKRTYYNGGTRPLQGSPLKGSILPPGSPSGEYDPNNRSRGPNVQTQQTQQHRRSRPYQSQATQREYRPDSSPYASTASLMGAPDADAAATAAGIADAAVSLGGIIVSGVVAINPGQTSYRNVGSKNIDNASEKRRKGEKRFQCRFENCHKLFTTNQNRQIHQWKHTGAKPYCCQCGYGSASRSDLRRHLNRKNVNPDCQELPVNQDYLSTLVAGEDDHC